MSSMNLRFMRSTTSISRYLSSRACCPCPSPDLVAVVHVASLVFIQFGGGLGVFGVLPLALLLELLLAPLPLLLSLAPPSPPLESLAWFTFNFIVLAWARSLDACVKGLGHVGRGCKEQIIQ